MFVVMFRRILILIGSSIHDMISANSANSTQQPGPVIQGLSCSRLTHGGSEFAEPDRSCNAV